MIEWLVIAAVVALAGAAVTLSNEIRQRVASWLREHDLNRSALMKAVILLDRSASGIRGRLQLGTERYGTRTVVLARTFAWSEIDDPALVAALRSAGHARADVLHQL